MSSAQGFWPIGWLKKWIDYNSNNACDASKKEEDGIGAEENEDVNEVAAAGECVATVSGIYIYPVKSCGRISLSHAQVVHKQVGLFCVYS
ncbi:hypothetical protein O6H91_06G089800 [Diphasiastrum complanatum]|uniref:Uncharacterized protein n=1 Tax=Diphasiastrum complanatum TaxID=34168 RepID=A0ACC2DGK2_DIPCM|nr:hypothetical protein O6H91_06G089800 [Diphasiastrum complanatum]